MFCFIIIGTSSSTLPFTHLEQVEQFRPLQLYMLSLEIALMQLVFLTVVARLLDLRIASKPGQGWRHDHGQENPRRYYQQDLTRRWKLDRGRSATHYRSGGNQPAYQSMINRRFMIVPPALSRDGYTETLRSKQGSSVPAT
jgi:hypothetical protein